MDLFDMKSFSKISIALLLMMVASALQAVEFRKYERSTTYLSSTKSEIWDRMVYTGLDYTTSILWPVDGLNQSQMYAFRKCIAQRMGGDSLTALMESQINDPQFPYLLHERLQKDVYESVYLTIGPPLRKTTKLPRNVDLDQCSNKMELYRSMRGVYTFHIHTVIMPAGAMGGCHYALSCLNYDLAQNSMLDLRDIFPEEQMKEVNAVFAKLTAQRLVEIGEREPEEAMSITADFELDPEDADEWYMSDQGIVCLFQCWEIASAAAGVVEVTIPVRQYRHLFRPEALKYWGLK